MNGSSILGTRIQIGGRILGVIVKVPTYHLLLLLVVGSTEYEVLEYEVLEVLITYRSCKKQLPTNSVGHLLGSTDDCGSSLATTPTVL